VDLLSSSELEILENGIKAAYMREGAEGGYTYIAEEANLDDGEVWEDDEGEAVDTGERESSDAETEEDVEDEVSGSDVSARGTGSERQTAQLTPSERMRAANMARNKVMLDDIEALASGLSVTSSKLAGESNIGNVITEHDMDVNEESSGDDNEVGEERTGEEQEGENDDSISGDDYISTESEGEENQSTAREEDRDFDSGGNIESNSISTLGMIYYLSLGGEEQLLTVWYIDPTSLWVDAMVAAACYDSEIQGVMLKENLQPGLHWCTNRLFNPLWVRGIYLSGSYRFASVNTMERIITRVNSLTPEILKKVESKLIGLIEDARAGAITKHGEDFLHAALSLKPTTTPASCVTHLPRMLKDHRKELQEEIGLMRSLSFLPVSTIAGCEAVSLSLENRNASSLLDEFNREVAKKLTAWHGPWTRSRDLPALTASDVQSVKPDIGLKVKSGKR
jgi:hypothetical protein